MSILPKEVNYSLAAVPLPSGTSSVDMVVQPANGAEFGENSSISFQLPQKGFLVPSSMYLRYRMSYEGSVTGMTAQNGEMRGVPAATAFRRSEVLVGSQNFETIDQFGGLVNVLYNLKTSHAQKAGQAFALGIDGAGSNGTITYANLNGRKDSCAGGAGAATVTDTTVTNDFAFPLANVLSLCDKLVPIQEMPQVEIRLTVDTVANMFNSVANLGVSELVLSNLELCYSVCEFAPEVVGAVMGMADETGTIQIKSQSYSWSSQTVQSGQSGQASYIFNTRLSSIKSLILLCGGSGDQVNGSIYDSVNIAGDGSYQFSIGGEMFPPRELSTARCKATVYQELSDALGGTAHDLYSSNMSITPAEFHSPENTASTFATPAKHYVAVNTEKLQTSALLTGVSSQLSPIDLRINYGANTVRAHQLSLITLHDALLQINVATKQASVRV